MNCILATPCITSSQNHFISSQYSYIDSITHPNDGIDAPVAIVGARVKPCSQTLVPTTTSLGISLCCRRDKVKGLAVVTTPITNDLLVRPSNNARARLQRQAKTLGRLCTGEWIVGSHMKLPQRSSGAPVHMRRTDATHSYRLTAQLCSSVKIK